MKEELLKGLTEEQIVKVKACKSQEEMLALAKCEGVELSSEQLEAVNGGNCETQKAKCPKCGQEGKVYADSYPGRQSVQCQNCGPSFIN